MDLENKLLKVRYIKVFKSCSADLSHTHVHICTQDAWRFRGFICISQEDAYMSLKSRLQEL